jgi:nucleoid-associated protein YgaU
MNALFPTNSRYHGIETATLDLADGSQVAYLRRRFVPPSGNFALLQEHVVVEGDRLDNLAAAYLGDPLLYWRICDANDELRPRDLVAEIGRRLRMTLPEGLPGGTDVVG